MGTNLVLLFRHDAVVSTIVSTCAALHDAAWVDEVFLQMSGQLLSVTERLLKLAEMLHFMFLAQVGY